VGQAIAMQKLIVATALGGSDQAERVSRYADQGLLFSSAPESSRLAESVLALYADQAGREAMRDRQAALSMRNGLDTAVDSLARLLRSQPAVRRADVDSRP
jgi:hypothetical protein